MHARVGLCAIATATLLLVAAPSALAQPQPTVADRETARSLMDEGDKKRDGGDLKGALKSYEGADAIMKVPTTGIEVAKTQIALGLLLEARDTLGHLLRNPAKSSDPPPFVAARKAAEALNADLAPRIPSIQVAIQHADPNTAPQITVDGEPIPPAAAAAPRKVNPGPHVVALKTGSTEKKAEVNVAERETKVINFDLHDTTDVVSPGPSKTVRAKPLPKILMYGGLGLAAVGIGVGSVTGLMSISKTGDLKDECRDNRCPPGKEGEIDDAKGLGNISTIAFVAGAAGVGAAVVGFVLLKKEQRESSAAVTPQARLVQPVIGPSYVGLSGTF